MAKFIINEKQYKKMIELINEDYFNHKDYQRQILQYLNNIAKGFNAYADMDIEKGREIYYIRLNTFTVVFAMDDTNGSLYIEKINTDYLEPNDSIEMMTQMMQLFNILKQNKFSIQTIS